MTPQEQQLVADLFNRLASLEGQRRDADAERLIRDGLGRAPNSVYTLVQTVLVQDEALKRANARIEELERSAAAPADSGGSFLDGVRNFVGGGRADPPRSSVPPVRGPGMGSSGVWGSGPGQGAPPPQPSGGQPWGNAPGGYPQGGGGYPQGGGYAPPPPQPGYPGAAPMAGGGGPSFLGTAAASAAGVVGGAMLLNGIRSMMGPHETFSIGGHHDPSIAHDPSSWDTGSGHLAQDAGAGDIGGHHHGAAAYDDDTGRDSSDDRFLGGSADDLAGNDSDFDDDDGGDFGGGDDFGGGGGDFDTA